MRVAKNREESRGRTPLLILLALLCVTGSVLAQSPTASPSAVRGFIQGFQGTYEGTPPAPGASPSPSPGAVNISNAVTFNDSFADESKVASREGLHIWRGNVTLSGRVANPGFEEEGEWTLLSSASYTGAIQALWASEGLRSFRLWSPAGTPRTAGDSASVSQAVNFTGARELRFSYRTSPQLPYHTLSVAVAGPGRSPPLPHTTLWSRTFDPTARSYFETREVSIPLPGNLSGVLDLSFRIETSANISKEFPTDVGVEIDDIRLLPDSLRPRGSLISIPVSTGPIVSAVGFASAVGNVTLQMSNDNGTTWEPAEWGKQAWFATRGGTFRYRIDLLPPAPGNNTSPAPLRTEVYDVRFFLETSPSLDFGVRMPRSAPVGSTVNILAEPDGLRYFFLVTAPSGLPMNLTRNATAFSFVPAMPGTYTVEVRALPLSGSASLTSNATLKRLTLQVPAGPPPPPAKPPELKAAAGAMVVRVYATPGMTDFPVEVRYWVESGSQQLSPGVVSGKIPPEGSTEFSIDLGNLKVGPGTYTFGVRVAAPDGTYDLKAPVTIAGIISTGGPPTLLLVAAGGAAGGGFAWFFWRKRMAARRKPAEGEPAFDTAAAQASMDAAASEAALPADTLYVEPPPPFVGAPPTRLARIAEAEMPPPPVVQAEIPDWTPPAPPPTEPEFKLPPGSLEELRQQKAALERELKELESYSGVLGGAKSAEEVRQELEGRREVRSRVRAALEAVEARLRALQGGAPTPVPAPVAPTPPSPTPPASRAEPPPSKAEEPSPFSGDIFGSESPLQAEIDRIEAELKKKRGARG